MSSPPSRLYHPEGFASGERLTLGPEASHHALRVLRLGVDDPIVLFDGQGRRAQARVIAASGKRLEVEVEACMQAGTESPLALGLAQALPGGDKMDWVVEKAVELGVAVIQPLSSRRSVLRLDAERAEKRRAHWQRIAIAACMQCGRDVVPRIEALRPIEAFLTQEVPSLRTLPAPTPIAGRLLLSPQDGIEAQDLAPPGADGLWLLVGPEGGLDDSETRQAKVCGWQALRLGPRVLRAETAGMVAAAVLQARFGDLGG